MPKKQAALKKNEFKDELLEIEEIIKADFSEDKKYRLLRKIFLDLSDALTEAREKAMYDSRTGLLLPKNGEEALRREMERTKRTGEKVCVAFMDIDYLKYINDRYGHVAGTKVILDVAKALLSVTRKYDIVCRYGGDEFLIVFPDTNYPEAVSLMNRIKKSILKTEFVNNIKVTLSYGLVECDGNEDETVESVLHSVDQVLYIAKQNRPKPPK